MSIARVTAPALAAGQHPGRSPWSAMSAWG